MKQYVLDVSAAAARPADAGAAEPVTAELVTAEAAALPLRQPGWWRWFLIALLLEPVALAILYLALSGTPGWSEAATSEAIPYVPFVASSSSPREAEPVPAPAPVAEAAVSRISQERGRYVVELHDEALAPALAMLAEATQARVAGSDIFIGSPLRLTRSAVAATAREAWQTVFGDVANFAIACAGRACEVRFVSLVKPGAPGAVLDSLQGQFPPTAPATAPAAQAPVGQAAGDAAAFPNGGEGVAAEN